MLTLHKTEFILIGLTIISWHLETELLQLEAVSSVVQMISSNLG